MTDNKITVNSRKVNFDYEFGTNIKINSKLFHGGTFNFVKRDIYYEDVSQLEFENKALQECLLEMIKLFECLFDNYNNLPNYACVKSDAAKALELADD